MPAKSRSQQRLFGMVHAYNKGEFHGPKSLRSRIAGLAARVSDEDASHFAKTRHTGLPEKKGSGRDSGWYKSAQVYMTPEQVNALMSRMPPVDYQAMLREREDEKPRTILGSALRGSLVGGSVGGLALGGLGAYLSSKATAGHSRQDRIRAMITAIAKLGSWGLTRGAALGAATGTGLNVLNRIGGLSR